MADSHPHPEANSYTDEATDPEASASPPGVPMWVKALGIVALLLVLLYVILHLTGLSPMGHGP
jgi:hypothetical protein